jgi:hypothetical protein
MAEEKQDGQKTLVAFVVGLLIGGMLVWAFSGPSANAPTDDADSKTKDSIEETDSSVKGGTVDDKKASETDEAKASVLQMGEGKIVVNDQASSASIKLESAVYPISEGWIGVREYNNENLGFILGVVRFSESNGLVPAEIVLQRPTTPGKSYAIVIFTENGDPGWNLADDVQIDKIFDTFKAE